MDSMFSLSVTREFVFRAKMSDGDVIECESFKQLYNHVRTALRIEVGNTSSRFSKYVSAFAVLEFGYTVHHEISKGRGVCEWHGIEDYGTMFVSNFSESFTRSSDNRELVNYRGCVDGFIVSNDYQYCE